MGRQPMARQTRTVTLASHVLHFETTTTTTTLAQHSCPDLQASNCTGTFGLSWLVLCLTALLILDSDRVSIPAGGDNTCSSACLCGKFVLLHSVYVHVCAPELLTALCTMEWPPLS